MKTRTRKKHISSIIFGFGITATSLIVMFLATNYFLFVTKEALPWNIYLIGGVVALFGLVIAGTHFAEEHLELDDEFKNYKEYCVDDWNAFKKGEITSTHVYILITLVSTIVFYAAYGYFQKWNAKWWNSADVTIITFTCVVTILIVFIPTDLFQKRFTRLPGGYFTIIAIGACIILAIGFWYAEPQEFGGTSAMERSQLVQSDNYWASTRGGNIYIFNDYSSGSTEVDYDCDGDACGYAALVILVVILIIGSALIAHFWVVASSILLTLMWLFTLRELFVVDSKLYKRRSY